MNATQRKNLGKGQSIECQTRAKLVRAAKENLERFSKLFGTREEAIDRINSRKPMERVRATGYEGSGRLMLEAASNLQRMNAPEDAAWAKAQKDVEQATAALQRALLRMEAIGANAYGEGWTEEDDMGDDDGEEE